MGPTYAVTASLSAEVGRYGNKVERCSDANRPSKELPSDDRTSLLSIVVSIGCCDDSPVMAAGSSVDCVDGREV